MASYFYSKLSSLFQDTKPEKRSAVILSENRIISNGTSVHRDVYNIPVVEITDSPSSIPRRIQKSASVGSISAASEDSRNTVGGRPSSAGSRAGSKEDERVTSQSPTYSSTTVSTLSPSRKCTEALQKVYICADQLPCMIEM